MDEECLYLNVYTPKVYITTIVLYLNAALLGWSKCKLTCDGLHLWRSFYCGKLSSYILIGFYT